jgi:hypothetical protein
MLNKTESNIYDEHIHIVTNIWRELLGTCIVISLGFICSKRTQRTARYRELQRINLKAFVLKLLHVVFGLLLA